MSDEIEKAFDSGKTVIIKAGGRTWEGTPEEFESLRDRLNEVEFRD
jgi:hypothetical protein